MFPAQVGDGEMLQWQEVTLQRIFSPKMPMISTCAEFLGEGAGLCAEGCGAEATIK